jgi:hypothetical protein
MIGYLGDSSSTGLVISSDPHPIYGPPAPPSSCEAINQPWYQSFLNFVESAGTGTDTTAEKTALIQQEHDCLVKAGMDDATAWAHANQDITGQLLAAGADPSQASVLHSFGALWNQLTGKSVTGVPLPNASWMQL